MGLLFLVTRGHTRGWDPPLSLAVSSFRTVLSLRYGYAMDWLATLRQADGLTYFLQWGTESLGRVAQIQKWKRKRGYPPDGGLGCIVEPSHGKGCSGSFRARNSEELKISSETWLRSHSLAQSYQHVLCATVLVVLKQM